MVVVEKTERKRSLRRSPQNIAFRLRPEDLHGKVLARATEDRDMGRQRRQRGWPETQRQRSSGESSKVKLTQIHRKPNPRSAFETAPPEEFWASTNLAITPERLGMHLEILLIRRIRPVSKRKTRDDEARRRWGKQSSTGLRMDRGSDLGWRPTTNDHRRPPETRFRRWGREDWDLGEKRLEKNFLSPLSSLFFSHIYWFHN